MINTLAAFYVPAIVVWITLILCLVGFNIGMIIALYTTDVEEKDNE